MDFKIKSDFDVKSSLIFPADGQSSTGADFVVYNYGDFSAFVSATGEVDEETLFTESVNKIPLSDAEDITYDNTTSGLVADDMQEAVDELLVAIQNNAGVTNLGYTPNPNKGTVTSDTGADTDIPVTDATNAGLFTSVQKDKLDALVVNFKGVFQELINLQQAFPAGADGDWAIVRDTDGAADWAAWDTDTGTWVTTDADSIVGQCNLTNTPTATNTTIHSDTGTDTIIAASTAVIAGLMSAADKAKLDAVEVGATGDQIASEVPSTAYGITTSTDVQSAIEQITDDKVDAVTGNTVTYDPEYIIPELKFHRNGYIQHVVWGISSATSTAAGVMSAADKIKLDAALTDASLSNTPSPTAILIATTGGTNTSIPLADATNAGLISASEKAKLAAVETGATGDQIASEVPSLAHGTTTSTNVQAAIEEITNDKIENVTYKETLAFSGVVVPVLNLHRDGQISPMGIPILPATTTVAGVMSSADKVKLDTLDNNYKGAYQTAAALNTAHITGDDGEWAIVLDPLGPAQHYSWDDNSSSWEAVDFASISGTTNLSNSTDAISLTVTSDTGSDTTLPAANATNAGVMTAAQSVDLTDTSAQADANTGLIVANINNITTNTNAIAAIDTTVDLSTTRTTTQATVTNTKGNNAILPLVDTNAGLMSPADKVKLDTVEANAKDDQTASQVASNATGSLSSTNVQAALTELDVEKAALSGATFTGNLAANLYFRINAWPGFGTGFARAWYDGTDTTIKHDGNATDMTINNRSVFQEADDVPFTPVGDVEATDVQAAIVEVAQDYKDYVISRGHGIITNYSGALGDNYNFSSLEFDPVQSPNLPASFRYDGYVTTKLSDELITVDPNAVYKTTCYLRQEGLSGDFSAFANEERHRQFGMIYQVDIDNNVIFSQYHMRYKQGGVESYTTLTQPLTPGDTVVHVSDASGWNQNTTVSPWYRSTATIFEYKNSLGFKYDYYSRLNNSSWVFNLAAAVHPVNVGAGTITFLTGMPSSMGNPDDANGTWPVGTRIANTDAGGTYKYVFFSSLTLPDVDKWYRQTNWLGGLDNSGRNIETNFSPGVSKIKLGWLVNYTNRVGGFGGFPDTGAGHSIWMAGMNLELEHTAKIETSATNSKTLHVLNTTIGGGYDFSPASKISNEEI